MRTWVSLRRYRTLVCVCIIVVAFAATTAFDEDVVSTSTRIVIMIIMKHCNQCMVVVEGLVVVVWVVVGIAAVAECWLPFVNIVF
jgi:hypothetical protein